MEYPSTWLLSTWIIWNFSVCNFFCPHYWFIQTFIYNNGLMDIYFVLQVIIQYYFILLLNLFQFYSLRIFQVASPSLRLTSWYTHTHILSLPYVAQDAPDSSYIYNLSPRIRYPRFLSLEDGIRKPSFGMLSLLITTRYSFRPSHLTEQINIDDTNPCI